MLLKKYYISTNGRENRQKNKAVEILQPYPYYRALLHQTLYGGSPKLLSVITKRFVERRSLRVLDFNFL